MKVTHSLERRNDTLGRATTLCGVEGVWSHQRGGVLLDNGRLYEISSQSPTCNACLTMLTRHAHES